MRTSHHPGQDGKRLRPPLCLCSLPVRCQLADLGEGAPCLTNGAVLMQIGRSESSLVSAWESVQNKRGPRPRVTSASTGSPEPLKQDKGGPHSLLKPSSYGCFAERHCPSKSNKERRTSTQFFLLSRPLHGHLPSCSMSGERLWCAVFPPGGREHLSPPFVFLLRNLPRSPKCVLTNYGMGEDQQCPSPRWQRTATSSVDRKKRVLKHTLKSKSGSVFFFYNEIMGHHLSDGTTLFSPF